VHVRVCRCEYVAVSVWVWVREGVGGCTVVGARVGSVCVYGCVSEWVGLWSWVRA